MQFFIADFFFAVFSLHLQIAQKSSYGRSEQRLITNVYPLGRLAVSGVPRPGFKRDKQTNNREVKMDLDPRRLQP